MNLLLLTPEQTQALIAAAIKTIGLPYKYGIETVGLKDPVALDCSEAVEFWFRKAGIQVPDGSANQWDASEPIKEYGNDIRPGDLIFTLSRKTGDVNHVAMAISSTELIEASGWKGAVVRGGIFEFTRTYLGAHATSRVDPLGWRRFRVESVKQIQEV